MKAFFEDLAARTPAWMAGTGPEADIVVFTSARLARNLPAFSFPNHASAVEMGTVFGDLCRRLEAFPQFAQPWVLDFLNLSSREIRCLREMHLATNALVRGQHPRGLVLTRELDRGLMINEEDHIRLQAFCSGFAPGAALAGVLELDRELEQRVELAFSEDLGYLTACPTNVGTALRMTALVHLPGLVLAGEIEKLLNALRQLQFTVRGLFGRGSPVRGALFMVSNMVTLGRDEEEVTEDFRNHVFKIISYERAARLQLNHRDSLGLEDMIQRSLAILSNARLLTAQEAFDRVSDLRLGMGLGHLASPDFGRLNVILCRQQSAHLEISAGSKLSSREKSSQRADLLRQWIGPVGG